MAVVLLAVGVLLAALISHATSTGDNRTAQPSIFGGSSQSLQPVPSEPKASSPTEEITPIVPTVPESPQNIPAIPESPQIVPAVPESPQHTQEQPQQAITDYYALMPENLPAGWQRLTATYQQNHTGGFTSYQSFWNAIQRVTVVDVSATQDGAVDATIDYVFKDGRVVEERTSYRLVTEDGLWKIDSSTVQSSYPKQGG
jgi:hypothetical protein